MRFGVVMLVSGLVTTVRTGAAQSKDTEPTLQQLEARVAGGDSLDAETQLRLARRYYQANRFDDEERALHASVAADPRYAPAWFWLGFLPFDRRPKLWKDVEKGKVAAEWTKPLAEAERMRVRAVLIDPFVDFRVMGAEEPSCTGLASMRSRTATTKQHTTPGTSITSTSTRANPPTLSRGSFFTTGDSRRRT
jgi:hypothetical protein